MKVLFSFFSVVELVFMELNLIPNLHSAPRVKPPMDPEDAVLLVDDEVVNRKEPLSMRKKDRPTDKGVAWLVKTQYISPLSLDPAKQVGLIELV